MGLFYFFEKKGLFVNLINFIMGEKKIKTFFFWNRK